MIGIGGKLNNISGDQGNMQQNFRQQGNLTRVNFREHLNLFWGNKGETPIFSREQGNMHPPPPPLGSPRLSVVSYVNKKLKQTILNTVKYLSKLNLA